MSFKMTCQADLSLHQKHLRDGEQTFLGMGRKIELLGFRVSLKFEDFQ